LDLSGNKVEDDGAMVISEILIHTSTLVSLNLTKSRITEEGAFYLLKGIKHNVKIKKIPVDLNYLISKETKQLLAHQLSVNNNPDLEELKKQDLEAVVPLIWHIERQLWIALEKESPLFCPLTTLPKSILRNQILPLCHQTYLHQIRLTYSY